MSIKVPQVSIRSDRVSFYERWEGYNAHYGLKKHRSLENLKKNKPNAELSKAAAQRITDAINWLLYLSREKKAYSKKTGSYFKFKIAFITLTLSSNQIHDDITIKDKLLNTFLLTLKRDYKVRHYVWRAEKQTNGNIHFHITVDKYIPHWELRDKWNRIQNNLSYVDRYHKKFKDITYKDYVSVSRSLSDVKESILKKRYQYGKSNGWYNPNSTDIHSVKKIKDISAYLTKYLTKKQENGAIQGYQWRLSYTLSKLKHIALDCLGDIEDEIKTAVDKYKLEINHYEYASIIYIHLWSLRRLCPLAVARTIDNYVNSVISPP